MSDLLISIAALSGARRAATDDAHKSAWGQFFTPPEIAAFMAAHVRVVAGQPVTILDPGAGTGILGVAAAQAALRAGAGAVRLIAVEAEPGTVPLLKEALNLARQQLGGAFYATLLARDFLDLQRLHPGSSPLPPIDVVVSNPPYFKLSPGDGRGGDAPNAYARFMEAAAGLLRAGGQSVFIVPRSFASGRYFQAFRRRYHAQMSLEAAHLFGSRRDAFAAESVLQESVILSHRKGATEGAAGGAAGGAGPVSVSSSDGLDDLRTPRRHTVPRAAALPPDDPAGVLWLPAGPEDLAVLEAVRGWPERLAGLGLAISTGPVVPFRTEALRRAGGPGTAPMLWMQHVRAGEVCWPLGAGFRKPEHIDSEAGRALLVPDRTYVLLRRFSAKEGARRLTAAVLEGGRLPGGGPGLENHLNYIHRPGGELDRALAHGLAALLGSRLIDSFFRIQSGNTQVSATEIRALPLPPAAQIREIGAAVLAAPGVADQESVERWMRGLGLSG